MKSKLVSEDGGRTFVLILDQGEEAFAAVTAFANERTITAASVVAIGAFESAKVGWFDLAARRYSPISVDEQCEVLSLLGDIAQGDDGKASPASPRGTRTSRRQRAGRSSSGRESSAHA